MESLERRELLAVGVTLSFSRGTANLTVNDNGANEVSVARLPSGAYNFISDGVSRQTAAWQTVNQIVISTKGGNDTITVDQSIAVKVTVKADGGNDWICGNGSGQLVAYGGTGNDFIRQNGTGALLAYGDGGDDTIIGGPNNDVIYCGAGNDIAKGQGGNDRIYGQSGFDTMYGGSGFDFEDGGCFGVDVYYVVPGEDTWKLDNQRNIHDIVYRFDPTSVTPPWSTQNGTLTVDWSHEGSGACITATGPSSVEIQWNGSSWCLTGINRFVFYGSPYDDFVDMSLFCGTTEMHGAAGNDTLRGGQANDVIFGDAGNDWLYGGPGNDQINGGDGLDQVWGGTGADSVNLQDGQLGDRFNDFNPGEGDTLQGDGSSSISVADQQYDPFGQWWLLRGNTVSVTFSTYDDPLGRVPAYVNINGEDRGLHLFASSLRVEVPSLSAFSIDTLTRNSLLAAGFQIEVVIVSGGGVDPLNC